MSPDLLASATLQTRHAVLMTDAAGHTVWANPAFERMTGYRLDELRGCKPGALLQGPDTDRRAAQRLSECVHAGQPLDSVEILNYRKDRQPFWTELDITPLHDGTGALTHFVSIQKDVTERCTARQASEAAGLRHLQALEAGRIGVWEFQAEDPGPRLDASAHALIGRDDRGRGGPACWADLPPSLSRWQDLAGQALQSGQGLCIEAWVVDRQGRRSLRVSGQRVGKPPQSRLVGIVADETAVREAQSRAEAHALQAMLGIERQDVLGRLRREFRLPLNSMLGFAQLVRVDAQRSGLDAIAQRIEHIESAGLKLLDMLDELLAAATDAKGGRATLQPVLLRDMLLRHLPREVAFVEGRAFSAQCAVWADPTLLRRALSLAGGLGLIPGTSGSGPTLEVDGDRQHQRHCLRFAYPASAATATLTEQALRVDLIRRLLDDMGGSCDFVDSANGLQLTLNLRTAHGLQEDGHAPRGAAPDDIWAIRREVVGTVVYVEDDRGNVHVVEHALHSRPGVVLRVAPDVEVAQQILACDPLPQLVLVDLVLPGRSGRDLLAGMRQDPRLAQLPCVVLTSIDDLREENALRALGAVDYLTKPLRLDRLLGVVDRVLLDAAAGQVHRAG